ncbi:MAG TPA: hypothetical protein VFZ85_07315 [Jiangellaceae bacterium]
MVTWTWLGSDRWVMAAGRPGRIERLAAGRNHSRGTGIVAALATLALLDALAPQLERYDIDGVVP